MKFKKMLLYPVENPMRPVLLSFAGLLLLGIGIPANIELLNVVGGLLFLSSLALLFISFIYLLCIGEWKKSIYALLFLAALATIIGLLN